MIVGHPFDTVKVRLQTQDAKKPLYRGSFHCVGTIVKQESAKGLFKGMSSPMAGLAFINAIVFGVYGNMQRYLPDPDSIRSHTISGCTAGLVQCLVTSPMEMTKIRMQIQGIESGSLGANSKSPSKKIYKSPMDCLIKVQRSEGLRGVYRGLGITAVRDAPGFGAYFASYEFMTRRVFIDSNGDVGMFGLFMAGGLAGIISWLASYPFDVIKSRYQADGVAGSKIYANVMDCVFKSYREEGVRVFFKGFNTTIVRAFPVNAATFSVVAWVLKVFGEDTKPAETHKEVSVKRVSGTIDQNCI